MDACPECGFQRPSYNSCRNRHCPKCQTLLKERWIENQSYDLLNIQYFHVVFTVPAELNPIFLSNQEKLYRLLFSCAAETLTQLAWNKKYLGAQIGCIEVLHTWGQRLDFHPHIHCIVPGGGLNKIGQWVSSRKKFSRFPQPCRSMLQERMGHILQTAIQKFFWRDKLSRQIYSPGSDFQQPDTERPEGSGHIQMAGLF